MHGNKTMEIKKYISKEKEYLINLRRHFHSHPEVSLQEFETCKKIEEELDRFGIPHQRLKDTAVYAWIDGKKGLLDSESQEQRAKAVVALRADIDALAMKDLKEEDYRSQQEGCCHACGHDAHTASLLAAAKVLKEKECEFSGQIRLFFQPAEEIGQGARIFVREGLLTGVKRVFGLHVTSNLESGRIALTAGPQNASCDYFKIKITGKGAHVSTPQLGMDAAYIASQIVINLQSIVSRNTAPLESVVVGVGVIKAGTQYNIIAEHAEIEGTTRSFLPEIRAFTNNRVVQIAEQTAKLYGARAEVDFLDFAAPIVNDAEVAAEVSTITEPLVGSENIVTDFKRALGADDFADYLQVTKGMYAFLGTKNVAKPNTASAQHHGLFDIDEEALLLAANVYVDYALSVLEEE